MKGQLASLAEGSGIRERYTLAFNFHGDLLPSLDAGTILRAAVRVSDDLFQALRPDRLVLASPPEAFAIRSLRVQDGESYTCLPIEKGSVGSFSKIERGPLIVAGTVLELELEVLIPSVGRFGVVLLSEAYP